ncbi:Predicted protein [Mesomycoplasma hyopneumoniae 168]|uniref:Uncharacterized protein n=1 Tax=Mesomycoplasma hyopneumoniae (strain 168) TaxID=907287 RepID=E4QTY0_MESH1|nr:Predicted protein [Mesomycoplasma hyopneumoniae 168]
MNFWVFPERVSPRIKAWEFVVVQYLISLFFLFNRLVLITQPASCFSSIFENKESNFVFEPFFLISS